jgi:AraC-like DNA-binding protein
MGFRCARSAGQSLAVAFSTSLQTGNRNDSGQYLKEVRLRRAAKLLRATFLNIKQIVEDVGLGSNAHFVRDFRKLYGITPTAYRRLNGRTAQRHRRRKKKRVASRGKI